MECGSNIYSVACSLSLCRLLTHLDVPVAVTQTTEFSPPLLLSVSKSLPCNYLYVVCIFSTHPYKNMFRIDSVSEWTIRSV